MDFRQLNTLVKERHDSFARLKTTEDLLEALRGENEILKAGVGGSVSTKNSNAQNSKFIVLKLICFIYWKNGQLDKNFDW